MELYCTMKNLGNYSQLKHASRILDKLSRWDILYLLGLAGVDTGHYSLLSKRTNKRTFLTKLGIDTCVLDNPKSKI